MSPKATPGELPGQRGDQITTVTCSTSPINPPALHPSPGSMQLPARAPELRLHPSLSSSRDQPVGFHTHIIQQPVWWTLWCWVGFSCAGDAVAAGYVYLGHAVPPALLTVITSSSTTKLFCTIDAPKITPAPPGRCPSPQWGGDALGRGVPLCILLTELQLWVARTMREALQNLTVGHGLRSLDPPGSCLLL